MVRGEARPGGPARRFAIRPPFLQRRDGHGGGPTLGFAQPWVTSSRWRMRFWLRSPRRAAKPCRRESTTTCACSTVGATGCATHCTASSCRIPRTGLSSSCRGGSPRLTTCCVGGDGHVGGRHAHRPLPPAHVARRVPRRGVRADRVRAPSPGGRARGWRLSETGVARPTWLRRRTGGARAESRRRAMRSLLAVASPPVDPESSRG
jgi:hypothetical protein